MTRDDAIEKAAGALVREQSMGTCRIGRVCTICDCHRPDMRDHFARKEAAAVLDAIGWTQPIGYLAAEPGALIGAYPTLDQAARSGWGEAVYAVVPVQGPSKLDANEGGE